MGLDRTISPAVTEFAFSILLFGPLGTDKTIMWMCVAKCAEWMAFNMAKKLILRIAQIGSHPLDKGKHIDIKAETSHCYSYFYLQDLCLQRVG